MNADIEKVGMSRAMELSARIALLTYHWSHENRGGVEEFCKWASDPSNHPATKEFIVPAFWPNLTFMCLQTLTAYVVCNKEWLKLDLVALAVAHWANWVLKRWGK